MHFSRAPSAIAALALSIALAGPALAVPTGQPAPYSPPAYNQWVSGGATWNSPSGPSTQTHVYDTSRLSDTVPARADIVCARWGYANWMGGSTGESAPPGPVVVTGALELNSGYSGSTPWAVQAAGNQVYPFTFNGSGSVTIPSNGFALTDPLCVPMAAGSLYYVRTWRQSLAGSVSALPTDRYMDISRKDAAIDGFFSGVALGTSSTATTTPSGTLSATYVGLPIRPGSVTLTGTNITGSVTDVDGGSGTGTFSGNGITAGTITYATGAISLTMGTATAPNAIFAKGQGYWNVALPDQTTVPSPANFVSVYNQYEVYGPSLVQFKYAPYAIKQPFFLWLDGDSIDESWASQYYTQSWAVKAVANAFGIVKTAQHSVGTAACASPAASWRRQSMALQGGPADRFILNTATNDIAGGMALATIEANITACVQQYAKGVKGGVSNIYVATVTPHSASASSNAPFGSAALFGPGTVASGSPSVRNAYNAWLYTQVGTLWAGVIDIAACVEGNPASQAGAGDGTWKSLGYTADGLHPNETGEQVIAACVASSPAFAAP